MKKNLLLILPIFLFTLVSNAQNHVWDFSDTAVWTSTTGVSTSTPNYLGTGLDIISSGSTMGVIASSAVTFSDGFVSSRAMTFQTAGSTPPPVLPTNRAVSFPVTGPCTVKVWVSTSSTNRVISVSDGTSVLGSWTSGGSPSSPYRNVLAAYYTGGPGTIYVCTNNTMNVAKLSVETGLGIEDIKADSLPVFYTNGNQVFVSNVKSNTTVSVYSITGALVKTFETNTDTNFELGTGLWIARVKSEEGVKSVKLVVRH